MRSPADPIRVHSPSPATADLADGGGAASGGNATWGHVGFGGGGGEFEPLGDGAAVTGAVLDAIATGAGSGSAVGTGPALGSRGGDGPQPFATKRVTRKLSALPSVEGPGTRAS